MNHPTCLDNVTAIGQRTERRRARCSPVGIMAIVAAAALAALWPASALAVTQPRLETTASYAVLAGTTVTNTGYSALTGGLSLSPGTAVTGFPPGISGTQDLSDAAAIPAQSDLATGYDDAASATSNDNLSGCWSAVATLLLHCGVAAGLPLGNLGAAVMCRIPVTP